MNIRTITKNQQKFALSPNNDEKVPPYKINHMNELLSLANKFGRNVEKMVEEPANIIFGDSISTPSPPKLSKKPAISLFARQPEKRRCIFPSPVAEESSDKWQLRSDHKCNCTCSFDCIPAMSFKLWPSPISAPLL